MPSELNIVHVQVRISREEKEQLDKLVGPGQQQNFLRKLIQDALREQAEKHKHKEEHDLLDFILDAGGEAATTIRTMLRALAAQVRAAATHRKQTKAG